MNKESLDSIIQKELYAEFDSTALENYVKRHLRERGYCVLHARNANKRFTCFIDKTEDRNTPGSFHSAYLGTAIRQLRNMGLHTERIVVAGTNTQIGECDIYVTLQGMVEPRELHRLFTSSTPQEMGSASNPVHTVLRIAQPVKMEPMEVTSHVTNAYNDPLMLTQTNPIGLRALIVTVTLIAALTTILVGSILQMI